MRYFEHKLKTPLTSDARLICYIPDNSEEIEPQKKGDYYLSWRIIRENVGSRSRADCTGTSIDGLCGVHSAIQLCSQEIS